VPDLLFDVPGPSTARRLLQDILTEYQSWARRAMDCLEGRFEDAMAIMHLPQSYRKHLRSTNALERLNQEIRRRERVGPHIHRRTVAGWFKMTL